MKFCLLNIQKHIILLFGAILLHFNVLAQLSVSITGNFNGCAPQILTFGCNVTGANGSVSYSWSSGNGDMSLLAEPTFSYISAGHYNLSVTVECNGHTATATREVVIFNGPTALFNDSAVIGCSPYTHEFRSLSETGDAAITNYLWYFGDGNSMRGQNRRHVYTSPGIFTVSLEVTDANGCTDIMHSQMLTVSKSPSVTIAANDAQWCVAPHEVGFSSEISTDVGLGGPYVATWNFGDGTNSNEDNPSHTYTQTGSFDVTLTVVDSYGCQTIVRNDEMVEIGTFAPNCVVPEQVCLNATTIFRSDADEVDCIWNFGDGSPSQYEPNASHTYSQTGTYSVSFTFDPNGPCRQTQVFSIEVVDVQASFRTEPEDLFSCTYPFNVRFISTSVGENLTYTYNFDDTYLGMDEDITHSYSQNGRYTPTLTVSSPGGCTSRFTGQEIVVNKPEASLHFSMPSGCVPATVEFLNNSDYTDNSAIVDYFWDFGDGSSMHTSDSLVEHEYTELGNYSTLLTITDTSGCTATSSVLIRTGEPVSPQQFGVMDAMHNYIPRDSVCPHDVVYLYNSMSGYSDIYGFFFMMNSGNKTWQVSTTNMYKPYSFDVDTGWNKVGFVVEYNNCLSPVSLWDSIYVKPPIALVSPFNNCSSPLNYSFKVIENLGAQYWEWLIYNAVTGDTLMYDPHSTTDSISITYPSYGSYECKFTAHNDEFDCEDGLTIMCNIMPPQFQWEISSDTLCLANRLTAVVLSAPSFVEVAFDWDGGSVPIDELEWITIDGITDDRHFYESGGDYEVIAYARQSDGCIYEFYKQVYVVDPQSSITPENASGCVPATFDFELITHTDDPLRSVEWNFGDGQTSTGQNVSHTYSVAGTYNVSVNMMTMHGCRFSANYTDRVKIFETPDTYVEFAEQVCLGTEQVFSAENQSSSIWHEWNFGDGTIASGTSNTVTHQYEQVGLYSLTHIASIRDNGIAVCSDTAVYEESILVQNIISVEFSLDSTVYNCYPVCPTIHTSIHTDPEYVSKRYTWNMGNGDVLHVQNPRYLYTSPGTYNIVLEVTTPGGCSSTYSQTVEISGPEADISLSDTIVCAGGSVHFAMTNAVNVESFVWVVGGGDSYANMPEVTHTYDYVPQSGYFPVTLSLQNGNCTVDFTEQVYVYRISANFNLIDSKGSTVGEGACPPLEGRLEYSASAEVTPHWYVNGVEQTETLLSWTNSSTLVDSLNVVSLSVTDSLGCVDSISHNYLVYRLPSVQTYGDTLICRGGEARISVVGGSAYYWELPIGDSAQIQKISPTEATIYYVYTFSEKGCTKLDSVMVDVMQSFDAEIDGQSFAINMGDTAVSVVVADSGLECYVLPEEYSLSGNCDSIRMFPLENTTFTLVLRDTLGCEEKSFDIYVDVDLKLTLDVPSAFTPLSEGDGNNVVYVRGLGIKRLRQFRIYNRWGEEVFFADDLHTGWDGTIGGVVQNQDTYSYYVEAEMFDGSIKTKKGNIVLIK